MTSRVILAYKEAFLALVPYVFASSLCMLAVQFWDQLGLSKHLISTESIELLTFTLNDFFPFTLMLAVASRFARRFEINPVLVVLCSITVLLAVKVLSAHETNYSFMTTSDSFLVLLIPPMSVFFFNYLAKNNEAIRSSSGGVDVTLRSLAPFTLISIVVITLSLLLLFISACLLEVSSGIWTQLDAQVVFYSRVLLEHVLWFFGLHGANILHVIQGGEILNFESSYGLSYKEIFDVFVIFGGSGATLGLVFAILFYSKDNHMRRTAQLALPFSIFNINELIIYGLPIVFNRYLLVPFVGLPLLNSFIAFKALPLMALTPANIEIAWSTPVFVNAYILYNGAWQPIVLQCVLLLLNLLIYFPFARHYSQIQSVSYQSARLGKNLGISEHLATRESLASYQAEQSIIHANEEVAHIVRLLEQSDLLVYYQPVIDVEAGVCRRFEALLRLKKTDGTIVGPYFLDQLEHAGMAPQIDLWVSRQVKDDLHNWREQGTTPFININLHPDTLMLPEVVEKIIDMHQGESVAFEVIERGLNRSGAQEALNRLKQCGFKISIDDFGSGYSSFDELCRLPFDSLKLDKSLIDLLDKQKGEVIIQQIAALCQELKVDCVAEGVENAWQVEQLKSKKIKLIQGFYFSKAIPADEVIFYSKQSF